jgi:hypothetical protein
MNKEWVKDTWLLGCLHSKKISYRERPCRSHPFQLVPGLHKCVDIETGIISYHIDKISPIRTSIRKNGTGKINWFSGPLHHVVEIYIPFIITLGSWYRKK